MSRMNLDRKIEGTTKDVMLSMGRWETDVEAVEDERVRVENLEIEIVGGFH